MSPDADSKLIMSYPVSGRDAEYADAFMSDLAGRPTSRVQFTADGHKAYLEAVEGAFGADVDYAMLVQLYGPTPGSTTGRYNPAECTGIKKTTITGGPDEAHVSTSYVERQNLTVRMHRKRFTCLSNAFSKEPEDHAHMVALYTVLYNSLKMHTKHPRSLAMVAGVSDRLWYVEDVAALVEAAAPSRGSVARIKNSKSRICIQNPRCQLKERSALAFANMTNVGERAF